MPTKSDIADLLNSPLCDRITGREPIFDMKFCEQLKAERKRLKLTQQATAALLSLPARTYWEYESGATEPVAIAREGALARMAAATASAS